MVEVCSTFIFWLVASWLITPCRGEAGLNAIMLLNNQMSCSEHRLSGALFSGMNFFILVGDLLTEQDKVFANVPSAF